MNQCLIIDDSAVIRKVARRILEGLGFEVTEAEDAAEALLACRREMPQVILLDGVMPGMSGYDFLSKLRKMPEGGNPRVILCATENEVVMIARSFRAGANAFLQKPFDRDLLVSKLVETGALEPASAA